MVNKKLITLGLICVVLSVGVIGAVMALNQKDNELQMKTNQISNSRMEPRAGFDPATNSLRGCRSTGLSHRGVYCELSGIHIFKTFGSKQPPQRCP